MAVKHIQSQGAYRQIHNLVRVHVLPRPTGVRLATVRSDGRFGALLKQEWVGWALIDQRLAAANNR